MRVTRHPYEVEGWGVGELWVGDGRVVVAHDPPVPGASMSGAALSSADMSPTRPRGTPGVPTETLSSTSPREGNGFVTDLLQSLHGYFAGERVSFGDVPLGGGWGTPFQGALAAALRAVPWGRGRQLRRAVRARRPSTRR